MASKHVFKYLFQLSFLLLVVYSCSSSKDTAKVNSNNPEFAQFISAHTGGIVPIDNPIRIQLVNPVENIKDLPQDLISTNPKVKGKVSLIEPHTIEFLPEENLESNKEYKVIFNLSTLVDVEDDLSDFIFEFKTRPLAYQLYVDVVHAPDYNDLTKLEIPGKINFNDPVDFSAVKKMLEVGQNSKSLHVEWVQVDERQYNFIIKNVSRGKTDSKVSIKTRGNVVGSKNNYTRSVEIPSLDKFKVTDIRVKNFPNQTIEIHFSDPLHQVQDLTSSISLTGSSDYPQISAMADGFKVVVYPEKRLTGEYTLKIHSTVKNTKSKQLGTGLKKSIVFEDLKPQVQLLGEGNILPSFNSVHFPFKAVNLSAVDVKIFKIFENNIIQFLQVNDLDGGYQLTRVGKAVYEGKLELDKKGSLNLNEWNNFSLDLSEYIKVEKGAIYRVELSFKKEHSVYPCEEDESVKVNDLQEVTVEYEEPWNEKGWSDYYYDDYYYDDYYYDDYYYDYYERDNPCSPSYYHYKSVSRNILISDIGMIAKAGTNKEMTIYLTHLNTLNPISGAQISFYDYQQQHLATETSDTDGKVTVRLKNKPFVAIATHQGQKGYLKLMDQNSNSISKFDVSGQTVREGVKGFIYAERGVWRPGDSIYVSFILEDAESKLPTYHPIIMEWYDPQGNFIEKKVQNYTGQSIIDFRTATSMDAPTGSYRATVRVGNQVFSKYFKVETIKPNRLKIEMSTGKDNQILSGDDQTIEMQVNWLHGAAGKNLRTKIEGSFSGSATKFKSYESFIFDDPTKSVSSRERVFYDGRTSEDGSLSFVPDWDLGESAPGKLTASMTTRVFEEGGEFSINQNYLTYSPYSSYVGIKVPEGTLYGNTLVTDKDHKVELVHLDENGKPKETTFEIKVYELRWRWWWDSYDYNLSSYISGTGAVVKDRKTIRSNNGRAVYSFRIDRPDWGRYLIHVTNTASGHSTGKIVYVDWPYEYRTNRKDAENNTMLTFSSNKDTYITGEDVHLSIPSPSKGKALVSIENGTKVVHSFWTDTEKGETKVSFKTTPEMSPNVYVHVSLIQPYQQTTNDFPMRMYGIVPISVENPRTHLEPTISCQEVFKPKSTVNVRVGEKNNQKMTYTLAIVDDGLLDLTNFKTPDPWSYFYAREALGVKTWDMYDAVIKSFGGDLDALLAIGGGAGAGEDVKNGHKANRFEPMVRFIGPFEYNGFASNNHKIEIPNYVGSVRVMVVAGNTKSKAYGNAEKTVPVRNPLMVLATLPRVLTPGESIDLPVSVFAMKEGIKDVKVSVSSNENIKITGAKSQKIRFSKPGDEMVYFSTQVSEKPGIAKVKILAEGGGKKATYEMELDIRYPNPEISEVKELTIDPGNKITVPVNWFGISGTNSGTVQLSSFPAIDFGSKLKYLTSYPHGCIEQTVSKAFPQLYITQVTKLEASFEKKTTENVKEAIQKLTSFQQSDGGFSYWPGSSYYNTWATSYAGHFLLAAEEEGYSIPSGMKRNFVRYQKKTAKSWSFPSNKNYYGSDLDQAYRLYTLALANSADMGAMNRLREYKYLSVAAKWRLAAAYAIIGQKKVALDLIENAGMKTQSYDYSYTYGSAERDLAMMLETLMLIKSEKNATRIARQIAKNMNANSWYSTQTTAMALIALSKYLKTIHQGSAMKYEITAGTLRESKTHSGSMIQYSFNEKTQSVTIENKGSNTLFAQISVQGIPAAEFIPAQSGNINLTVNYYTTNGNSINPEQILQGTDFYASISVSNPASNGDIRDVALECLFPSGWEILTSRLFDNFGSQNTGSFDYQDIRDDRVYTYFSMGAGTTKMFQIKLNAAYSGDYYTPAIRVGSMYDNGISANTSSGRSVVYKQDSESL